MFERNYGCFIFLIILFLIFGPKLVIYLLAFPFIFTLLVVLFFTLFGNLFLKELSFNSYMRNQSDSHNLFGEYLVHFMVTMANADGEISGAEIQVIRNFFMFKMRFGKPQMLWVNRLIEKAMKDPRRIEDLVEEFNQHFGLHEKRLALQLLWEVAMVDGRLHDQEKELLKKITSLFGLETFEYENFSHYYQERGRSSSRAGTDDPYQVLGIPHNASPTDIKKRYRKLCMEYHPDRVAHLGDDFKKVAEEKMIVANLAYEELKRRGKVS